MALWTPELIATVGWWDASDTDTITDSGGEVSQIDDLSGNANHLVQATAAAKPTTDSRTIFYRNVLDHDGGDRLVKTGVSIPSSGDLAMFMVAGIDDPTDVSAGIYCLNDPSSPYNDFVLEANNASQFDGEIVQRNIGSDKTLTGGPFPGTSMYEMVFDFAGAGVYNTYIDGTKRTTDTTYSAKLAATQDIKAFTNQAESYSLNGAWGEFIICEDVTELTRQKIEGYLAWKWGLEGNLPGGHPYEDDPPLAIKAGPLIGGILV